MRRPDVLEWLLIAASLLAAAGLAEAVHVAANASLVDTLTAEVVASNAERAARLAEPDARPDTDDLPGPHDALDQASTAMASDIAERTARHATWLALANAGLVVVLVVATVLRARQLRRPTHA